MCLVFPVPSRDSVTLLIFIKKKVNDFHLLYDFLSIDLVQVFLLVKNPKEPFRFTAIDMLSFTKLLIKRLLTDKV